MHLGDVHVLTVQRSLDLNLRTPGSDVHVLTVQRGLDLNLRTPGSDGHAQCSTMVCTDFCLVSHIVKSYDGGDDDDDGDDDATL